MGPSQVAPRQMALGIWRSYEMESEGGGMCTKYNFSVWQLWKTIREQKNWAKPSSARIFADLERSLRIKGRFKSEYLLT